VPWSRYLFLATLFFSAVVLNNAGQPEEKSMSELLLNTAVHFLTRALSMRVQR